MGIYSVARSGTWWTQVFLPPPSTFRVMPRAAGCWVLFLKNKNKKCLEEREGKHLSAQYFNLRRILSCNLWAFRAFYSLGLNWTWQFQSICAACRWQKNWWRGCKSVFFVFLVGASKRGWERERAQVSEWVWVINTVGWYGDRRWDKSEVYRFVVQTTGPRQRAHGVVIVKLVKNNFYHIRLHLVGCQGAIELALSLDCEL